MDTWHAHARLYRALAHPTRLRILHILSRQEACVCHLTAVLSQRQPYVSQQLAALRDSGLVVGRREGTLVYYRLRDARLAAILALGQSLVAGMHLAESTLPATPEGPVPGCPCPRCQEAGASHLAPEQDKAGAAVTS